MTITIHDELRSIIRMHVDGVPAHTLQALLMSSAHGPWCVRQIHDAMANARADGFAFIDSEGAWHQTAFSIAQERYQERRLIAPTRMELAGDFLRACFGKRFWKLWLMVAILLATVGGCMRMAQGVEVPDRILRALVAVESGCDWRDIGDVRGQWSRGADGEASPFQLAPVALASMGVTDIRRVHRDVVWAESLARLYLSRCFERHGNWADSLAAYNAGSRYRSRQARDYARRVLALAAL